MTPNCDCVTHAALGMQISQTFTPRGMFASKLVFLKVQTAQTRHQTPCFQPPRPPITSWNKTKPIANQWNGPKLRLKCRYCNPSVLFPCWSLERCLGFGLTPVLASAASTQSHPHPPTTTEDDFLLFSGRLSRAWIPQERKSEDSPALLRDKETIVDLELKKKKRHKWHF